MALAALFALAVRLAVAGAPGTPPGTPPAAMESRTLVGQIVEIDLAGKSVLVTESIKMTKPKGAAPAKKAQTVRVSLVKETLLVRGKTTATFSDLKTKDHVVVRYRLTPEGATALSFRVAVSMDRSQATSVTPAAPVASSSASEASSTTGE